ncbi:thiamine-phosphate kinase [Sphingosinicellaceae bacterium]|nr:thiamine-phosphate kinase [Sphingosinicellaceae bacterium]
MRERQLIADLLAPLATHKAARGLSDDAAVWPPPLGREVVLTHDTIASGVHYLATDPPSDIAWKLLAVNLSDLAAMGATPAGVLLGVTLGPAEDDDWLRAFVTGLGRALTHFEVALFGGDTVSWGGAAVLGCTALGHVEHGAALGRGGAHVGDEVWVSGTIGDAGLGLVVAQGDAASDRYLLNRYRRPDPRLALGRTLVGLANAAMDVSDGLLIDAERLAAASGVAVEIDLGAVPLSPAARARAGDGEVARLAFATSGDDYELLFTAPVDAGIAALATAKVPLTRIGRIVSGTGVAVLGASGPLTPTRLGYEH